MIANLADRIRAFRGRRVLVIGEAMLDSYVTGRAERLSREAPVPIVALTGRVDAPGGAGNTAVNVSALGGEAILLSVVGSDAEGERLRAALRDAGVDPAMVIVDPARTTLAKERIGADGQLLLRVDTGTTEHIDGAGEHRLIDALRAAWPRVDAVIVSDYDYGVMTPAVRAELARLHAATPRVLVVDARDLTRYRSLEVTAAKPNYLEAVRLLGEADRRGSRARATQIGSAGDRLLSLTGAQIVAVTLDADGVIVFERGEPPYRTYCRPHSDAQAAGGGDTFVATFGLALGSGASTTEAAELASTAAAVVVGKPGTATCSAYDLEQAISAGGKRIQRAAELADRMRYEREQGRRIVFTNGCFDILHRGHVSYLNRAKGLGDVLVVGVNSDASVRRLKGENRPINGLDDRMLMLEALSCVDYVVSFDEDTPDALIRAVRPEVFAKGGDYTRDTLPESRLVEALGGTVQILPLVDDRSTTRLIERVQSRGQAADDREPSLAGRR